MADQKVKVYDGSTWQDIESNAKLPVAASDGKSQVDGKDGLIIIENLEDNGEIGLHWDTKAGSRWRTVVEEGLAGGQMTFYDSSNEAVFTLKQDGTVLIEQGTDPSETGNQVATAAYVRLLMNTFPIVDTEQIIKIDSGTDNENLANPNIKKIYFGIGGQSVDNPDRILTISIDTDADPDAKHITAHEDYTPTDPQDLVTKSWIASNTRLPAMGDDAGGNDFRVEYLDRNHNAEGVQEIDPANPSCIRLGVFGGLATAGLVRAGSFLVDGLGRLLASQSGYNSSQKPSRSMMMGLYSATDIGNTRTGVALRGYHYGDIPEGSTQQGVSYTYGFYSSPNYQNLKVTTSIDYLAVGPSGNLDPESGESLSNGSVQTAVGFSIPSNFGSYIKHPLGGNPITQGFRSDLALQDNKNQYAIFVNGTAPSRFNSNIQLTSNCAITTAVDTDAKLTISGTQAQVESTGYSPLRVKNLASNGACIVSQSAYGSYTFGTTGLGWSIITSANDYRLSVTDDETRFYKTDGSTTQLLINDTMIRASSDYEPSGDYDLATKKYVDDNLGNGGGSANISAGTPANEVDADAVAGDMMFDENYLWLKTSTVWKKIPLLGFSSTPTGPTLQLTQEQYDAIPVKDDNTLYVIVG